MAIGFTVGVIVRTPDKMLSRSTQPKVRVASFGDGYEQRLPDGINTLKETFSVSFNTRTKVEIDDIVTFFDNNKDKQDAMVQALRSATTTAKLFDVLGLEYNLRMDKS